MTYGLIEYVFSGRALPAASEATWEPHWLFKLKGTLLKFPSKGNCFSSLFADSICHFSMPVDADRPQRTLYKCADCCVLRKDCYYINFPLESSNNTK